MKKNILTAKLIATILVVAPLVANASVVVYAYKGSSTTVGGNGSRVIAHTGTLVLDADPNSEAYLSGTYVGEFSLGSGKNKQTYFISRTFDPDVSQLFGPKGSRYTVLAKAETPGSHYSGSVLHFEGAKGINTAIKIKTSGETVDLPQTLVSKDYIVIEDGSNDYVTESSGAYSIDRVKTVGYNDANMTVSAAVIALEKTYKDKKYTQWDAGVSPGPGMPKPKLKPDDEPPVITLKGSDPMTVSVGESFTDPGADVKDNLDGDRVILGNGTVNKNVPGTYTLTYSASDAAGNAALAKTRSVKVVDTAAPVITLKGSNPMTISAGGNFTDPGAEVSDMVDGDWVISGNGTVNKNVPGTYTLTYSASDAAGNAALAKTRSVKVVDTKAPVITLKGSDPMTVSVGESFTDPGADVTDNVDGDRVISGNGTVNPNVPGTYTLTYSASDAAGNAATAVTRSVVVSSIVSVAGGTLPSGSALSGQSVAAFQIGVYEVTYSEWQAVCANATAGYTDLVVGAGGGANYPVTNVNWYDVVKWCNAKSEQEGLTPVYTLNGTTYKTGSPSDSGPLPTVNANANGYRLPTEKEWEWAARGGVNSQAFSYSGSNVAGEVAWAYENSANVSHPVGTKQQNELGIYDMSGNVWEWCEDLVSGMSKRRRRGGAFNYLYTRSRMIERSSDYDSPSMRESNIGFRVAKNSAN